MMPPVLVRENDDSRIREEWRIMPKEDKRYQLLCQAELHRFVTVGIFGNAEEFMQRLLPLLAKHPRIIQITEDVLMAVTGLPKKGAEICRDTMLSREEAARIMGAASSDATSAGIRIAGIEDVGKRFLAQVIFSKIILTQKNAYALSNLRTMLNKVAQGEVFNWARLVKQRLLDALQAIKNASKPVPFYYVTILQGILLYQCPNVRMPDGTEQQSPLAVWTNQGTGKWKKEQVQAADWVEKMYQACELTPGMFPPTAAKGKEKMEPGTSSRSETAATVIEIVDVEQLEEKLKADQGRQETAAAEEGWTAIADEDRIAAAEKKRKIEEEALAEKKRRTGERRRQILEILVEIERTKNPPSHNRTGNGVYTP